MDLRRRICRFDEGPGRERTGGVSSSKQKDREEADEEEEADIV